MKKTILCVLLFAACVNPTFSQDSMKIWITPEQEASVFRDRAVIKLQTKKIKEQSSALDSLQKENQLLQQELQRTIRENRKELERLHKVLYRDSAKISYLEEKLEDEKKRTAGYQAIAKTKSLQLAQMTKWRGRYYSLASITVFKISIPIAAFLAGTYFIMHSIK